ncbi:uncharacterized protein OCT59_004730 [Rhizophagus irregularis]|uniref:Uncharacterized protein n=2 Tax=Rhizophagus irregularis TaxID=588596 RepID=U9UH56_RHIID|nr:hypothetical protein GLOIN_2v1484743 [Rhizophagus irregularis DAOM 181602=DAOM 197198]EXX67480.1 hypothetical protein RirG_113980 [Rhizophagus irregularis DAOM 197198w]UZO13226.1 hypothetical protein OCT59_004730 [Rhizophagus irregularis]POG63375.1 hypothetical protein GLOIN_2v1484743 [Rhizophagus irregularis DAOM 181602=DAOM 197198]CAG8618074.1 2873_t:CDS:2 [Rhizophagus irregularis]GBC35506.1 hypothetical protein GLOIN_2v1484743 [Rhizophagus irregularis DAOM 181602=DAOM 197198]|eukprot:XP_025170241.1 hypothetical protein GLOIN_2v1484743 [Rhizophagus irregularis DAOM 181602=DAOM 197198]
MGKTKSIKKTAVTLSVPTSSSNGTKVPIKKYTEKEIINVLQYILDHYDDWINRKINQRTIIVRALDHHNMKNRTPYAMHFKISRLQFEYKCCGRTIGYSNTINDMVARILKENGAIDTVKFKEETVSNDEQIIEVMDKPALQEGELNKILKHNTCDQSKGQKPSGLPNEQFKTTIVPSNNEFGDFLSLIQANRAQISSLNKGHSIPPNVYTIMETLTTGEIYKMKLQEIREKFQEVKNETNREEFKAIEKLNQSYAEIIYILSQIEVRMAEMHAKKII